MFSGGIEIIERGHITHFEQTKDNSWDNIYLRISSILTADDVETTFFGRQLIASLSRKPRNRTSRSRHGRNVRHRGVSCAALQVLVREKCGDVCDAAVVRVQVRCRKSPGVESPPRLSCPPTISRWGSTIEDIWSTTALQSVHTLFWLAIASFIELPPVCM